MLRIASERESLCSVQWFSISPTCPLLELKIFFSHTYTLSPGTFSQTTSRKDKT